MTDQDVVLHLSAVSVDCDDSESGVSLLHALYVGSQLLYGILSRIQEPVNLTHGVFALLSRDNWFLLDDVFVAVAHQTIGPPWLALRTFFELIQDTDGAILANTVADFQGIDPHGQFSWEDGVDECWGEATAFTGVRDDRVHFAIDTDATIA